jgi:glycine C-acetyltransferase
MKKTKSQFLNSNDTGGLKEFKKRAKNTTLQQRVDDFYQYIQHVNPPERRIFFRLIDSSTGRVVRVIDEKTRQLKEVLMFGSNNYLGLADHPKVKERVMQCLKKYGAGIAGPPILNGYHQLMKELEDRLSALKQKEDTLIFPTGFSTNIGLINGLCTQNDVIVYDEYHHASFHDGLQIFRGQAIPFKHNDMRQLEQILTGLKLRNNQSLFIGFEGVYSMDGDLAPLPQLIEIAKKYGAVLIIDDAHGTGVLGEHGGGTCEHFHREKDIEVSMGTFSKSFGMNGGFVSSTKEIINYLRYNAKSYVFSAALSPMVLAAVIAGLEVMEEEPWLQKKLLENAAYARKRLSAFEFCARPEAAIIAVKKPKGANLRQVNRQLFERGIFVNTVEYPAVPKDEERFRISLSAVHTKEDIDHLATSMEEVLSIQNESV